MKRILSLVIGICLIFSSFATVLADGHSTKVKYVGNGESEWSLNVPIQLAPGESGNVVLTGTWDSVTTINVTADESVTLGNDIDESTKTLAITFDSISQVGNMDDDISVTKSISVANMEGGIFGIWEGIFNYYVVVDNISNSNPISNPLIHNGVIPEGGIYYIGLRNSGCVGEYDDATEIFSGGEIFPTPQMGDRYVYNDYEYAYNIVSDGSDYYENEEQDGWSVTYIGESKSPEPFLYNIAGEDVVNMQYVFYYTRDIVSVPTIPETIKYMDCAFYGLDCYFNGTVEINAVNLISYEDLFYNVGEDFLGVVYLTGTSPQLEQIASKYSLTIK